MSSRDISLCCSLVQAGVPKMQTAYAAANPGRELRVIQTMRSRVEQMGLYAKGRSAPGNIVTYADGVNTLSNHQVQTKHGEFACHACDFGIFEGETYITDADSYRPLEGLATDAGLKSGWSFPHADSDHVECNQE